MTPAPIDIVFISLILILAVRCGLRGFIEEFMSMAAIILGLFTGILFYKNGAAYIRAQFGIELLTELLAFVLLFLISFIAIKLLEHILRDIVDRINLGSVDHFFGIFLGLLEGLLVVALVLFILQIQPLFDPLPIFERSLFAEYMLPLISSIRGVGVEGTGV